MLVFLTESTLLMILLRNNPPPEPNAFAGITTYQVLGDVLISANNENTSDLAAVIGVSHLIKLIIVYCHSPASICPLLRLIGE